VRADGVGAGGGCAQVVAQQADQPSRLVGDAADRRPTRSTRSTTTRSTTTRSTSSTRGARGARGAGITHRLAYGSARFFSSVSAVPMITRSALRFSIPSIGILTSTERR